jgi:dihydropteroate synthase
MVNDVSGGLADPQMARLVAEAGVPVVVMHWRGHSAAMQDRAVYGDVVQEVRQELRQRVDAVIAQGVDPELIVVDPGLGFAKLPEHNWRLLARLDEISGLGGAGSPFPVIIGASRKRFLGRLLAADDAVRPFAGCDDATVAISALAAAAGAWCVRVHAVPGNADAVRVAARWRAAWPETGDPQQGPPHPGDRPQRAAWPETSGPQQGPPHPGARPQGRQPDEGQPDGGRARDGGRPPGGPPGERG